MTDVNDEMLAGLLSDDEFESKPAKPAKQAVPARTAKSASSKAAPKADVEPKVQAPKKKLYTIVIDQVDGLPNSEVVGVNGKIYQIMRGVEVEVPEEVVGVLKLAVAHRSVKFKDADGRDNVRLQPYSAIPWRIVSVREV